MLASAQGGWVGGYINNFPDDFKTAGHKGPCNLLLLLTCCTRSLAYAQQGAGGGVITLLTALTLLAKMAVPFPTSTYINMCRSWANSSQRRNICTRVFEIYPMASHDKVRNFHQLSASDPNKKQMNNDEHPSSPKNISKTMLPKAADFLVDLAGTAWPSWHLAKFLPFRPCMLRLSAPTGSAARCNAEPRFLITSSRTILGFCQRTPNGWSLFLQLKHIQTKKERGHILSAKTVSRWSYQEMSAKLWNLQCNHNGWWLGRPTR